MTEKYFNARQGITTGNSTVNTSINSISIAVTSNIVINATTFAVGNSTVNATMNSSIVTIGANLHANSSTVKAGNSTVNATLNSISLNVGANVVVNNIMIVVGNSTVNSAVNSTAGSFGSVLVGSNVTVNATTYFVGNSTVNTIISSVVLRMGNSTVNSAINSTAGFFGSVLVGANVTVNATTYQVGNSTVNTTLSSIVMRMGNSTHNTVINSTAVDISNSTVNSVINATMIAVTNSSANTKISPGSIQINGANVSSYASFRNKIINGNFDFWQRGTSVGLGSTSQGGSFILADRWCHTGNTATGGSSFGANQIAHTVGQTDVPGEPQYYMKVTANTGSGADDCVIFTQRIENVRTLAGQPFTLSFYAKADASKNVAVEFVQYFGTGGSPSANVSNVSTTTCALTTSWQKFTVSNTMPSISGKTIGTTTPGFVELNFWLDAGSDYNGRTNSLGNRSIVFEVSSVQLEPGLSATPFEQRLYAIEQILCQRYYIAGDMAAYGITTAAGSFSPDLVHFINFPVKMRAAPTIVGGASTAQYAVTYAGNTDGIRVTIDIISGTAGGILASNSFTANAEL